MFISLFRNKNDDWNREREFERATSLPVYWFPPGIIGDSSEIPKTFRRFQFGRNSRILKTWYSIFGNLMKFGSFVHWKWILEQGWTRGTYGHRMNPSQQVSWLPTPQQEHVAVRRRRNIASSTSRALSRPGLMGFRIRDRLYLVRGLPEMIARGLPSFRPLPEMLISFFIFARRAGREIWTDQD